MSADGVKDVRPVGRYEWEQIVRRARLTGAIRGSSRTGKNGKATRGGLSAATVKAVAFAYASYADDKGREVRPGDATIAVGLECGLKTVRAVKALLLELGLMQTVRAASRGRAEEYRLTLPADLLERLEVLTPGQFEMAAHGVRSAARGRRGTPTPVEPEELGWSAGHPQQGAWGGPPDTPNRVARESGGAPQKAMGWSGGPTWGGPPDPRTDQDRTSTTTTDHSGEELRTAVTVSRASPAAQDRIPSDVVGGARPPAGRPPDNRPRHRPRPRPVWWSEIEGRVVPPPDSPGRAAFAAARATLAARQASMHPTTPERAPGDAWDRLIALTT
jgi:hypothetical protein